MVKFISAGILLGLCIGFLTPIDISLLDGKLLLIVLLAGLDVIFSSSNAKLLKQFDYLLFTNEFILNSILSVALVYLGNIMGLDLFTAVSLVLILKMFYNLSKLTKSFVMTVRRKE